MNEVANVVMSTEQQERLQIHGIGPLALVTTFIGIRTTKDGEQRDVKVEVIDGGPENSRTRWSVQGTDCATGRVVSSHHEETLVAALESCHWWEWDPPSPAKAP